MNESERAALLECIEIWLAAKRFYQARSGYGGCTIVYKNGTHKTVDKTQAWEYENDPDYLVTIPALSDEWMCVNSEDDLPEEVTKERDRYKTGLEEISALTTLLPAGIAIRIAREALGE